MSGGEDYERLVVGGCLINPDAFHSAAAEVDATDFGDSRCRDAWEAMAAILGDGGSVDSVTVLRRMKAPDPKWFAGVTDGMPRVVSLEAWSRAVAAQATLRRLVAMASKIGEAAKRARPDEVDETVERALAGVVRVVERASDRTPVAQASAVTNRALAYADQIVQSAEGMLGLPTGLQDLDAALHGLRPGRLYIVGARTGMGKSILLMQMARENARAGRVVALFSAEMTADEVGFRLLCSGAEVAEDDLRAKSGQHEAWERFMREAALVAQDRLSVDESEVLTPAGIRARSYQIKAANSGQLDLVLVDYVQLVHPEKRSESREREVAEVSRALKRLAKSLNVPVVVAAQLNRGAEERRGRRPALWDLRESGALEQDADTVILLHRPKPRGKVRHGVERAEAIVAKNRGGSACVVPLDFRGAWYRFDDVGTGPLTGKMAEEPDDEQPEP